MRDGTAARRAAAFTTVELLLAVAILAVLAALAIPAYQDYRERVKITQAVADISTLNAKVRGYLEDNRAVPDSLADVGEGGKLDPWGQPYEFTNLQDKSNMGRARKNKNLVPINTLFDIYSKGKDGLSQPPLLSPQSRDDVVFANDGRFVGPAKDYE